MKSLQRKLLWTACRSPDEWVIFSENMPGPHDASSRRALASLARKGLVETRLMKARFLVPAHPRMHFRLTALGEQFCSAFSTPLQTGGRMRARHFEAIHGRKPPVPDRNKAWFKPTNRAPANSPNPERTASPTTQQ